MEQAKQRQHQHQIKEDAFVVEGRAIKSCDDLLFVSQCLLRSYYSETPNLLALKAFISLSSKYPQQFIDKVQKGEANDALHAALLLLNNRRFTKDFLAASGIAFSSIIISRALLSKQPPHLLIGHELFGIGSEAICSTEEEKNRIFRNEEERKGFKTLGSLGILSIIRGIVLNGFLNSIPQQQKMIVLSDEGFLLHKCLTEISLKESEKAEEQFILQLSVKALSDCLHLESISLVESKNCLGTPTSTTSFAFNMKQFINRCLGVVWKHLGNTVGAIQSSLIDIFVESRRIYSLVCCTNEEEIINHEELMAKRLLSMNWHAKGRYLPLIKLLESEKVNAQTLINLSSGGSLIGQLLDAIADRSVHTTARQLFSTLLKSVENKEKFAQNLIIELASRSSSSSSNPNEIDGTWRDLVEESLIALFSRMPQSLQQVLSCAITKATVFGNNDMNTSKSTVKTTARLLMVITILNQARKNSLPGAETAESLSELYKTCCSGNNNEEDNMWKVASRGLSHPEESVFIQALEFVCNSAKPSDFPTPQELELVKEFLISGSANSSMNSRQRMITPLAKFFERIRSVFIADSKMHKRKLKENEKPPQPSQVSQMLSFLQWTGDQLIAMTYPGASNDRVIFALTAYRTLLATLQKSIVVPYKLPASSAHVEALLACLWKTMDKCRQLAQEILMMTSEPLHGLTSFESICGVLKWALRLSHSPRMHQADAGGRLISVVISKVISGTSLKVSINLSQQQKINVSVTRSAKNEVDTNKNDLSSVVIDIVNQLLEILRFQISQAKTNLVQASQRFPMHGILTAIRYCLGTVNTDDAFSLSSNATKNSSSNNSSNSNSNSNKEWKILFNEIIQLSDEVYHIVLPVVADLAPEGFDPSAMNNNSSTSSSVDSNKRGSNVSLIQSIPQPPQEQLSSLATFDQQQNEDEAEDNSGTSSSAGQLVTVCSWLCVKEVSFLLASIHEIAPFPKNHDDSNNTNDIITLSQVKHSGDIFIHLLLSTRHKGAIEKAYEGFCSLCSQVIKSPSQEVNKLASIWVDRILSILNESPTTSPQPQMITRRSAGIPYCLSAILMNDVTSNVSSTELLSRAMGKLLELSTGDNGYAAQIHSFNIVSSLVNQKVVSSHIDHYLDKLLVRILNAYTSKDWGVRNAATIAFNMVVKRRIRAASFFEFFALHGYLLQNIEAMCKSDCGDLLQSSLFAVLTLLAKLHPSEIDNSCNSKTKSDGCGDDFNSNNCFCAIQSEPFIPFVRSCSSQRTFKIREAAATALISLVKPQNVLQVCLEIISELPSKGISINADMNKIHGNLLQLEKLIEYGLSQQVFSNPNNSNNTIPIELCNALESKLWLTVCRCSPICISMVRTLSLIHDNIFSSSLSNSSESNISPELESFRSSCLCACRSGLEMILSSQQQQQLPMDAIYSDVVTNICIKAAVRNSIVYEKDTGGETADQLIEKVLCCSFYEAKISAFRTLKYLSKTQQQQRQQQQQQKTTTAPFTAEKMRDRLCEMLFKDEQHPRVIKRIMQVLPWALKSSDNNNILIQKIWKRAEELLSEASLCQSATTLLGFCVGIWNEKEQVPDIYWNVIKQVLETNSDPLRIVSDRISAVHCCGLSLNNKRLSHEALYDIWNTLKTLLQDDDYFVRQEAGEAVSEFLHLNQPVSPPIALRYVISTLQSLGLTMNANEQEKQTTPTTSELKLPIENELLFEVEPSNFYIEETVLMQMENPTKSTTTNLSVALNNLENIAKKTKDTFISISNNNNQQQQQQQHNWERLFAYENEIFMPLYSTTLSVIKLMMNQSNTQESRNEIILNSIKESLQNIPLHPLVEQLIHRILKNNSLSTAQLLSNIDASSFLIPLEKL